MGDSPMDLRDWFRGEYTELMMDLMDWRDFEKLLRLVSSDKHAGREL
jgi:hypothetical protein